MNRKYITTLILLLVLVSVAAYLYYDRDEEDDRILDPAHWKDSYPDIYSSYARNADIGDVQFGGEQQIDYIKKYPNIKILYDGYGFSKEYFSTQGHIHTLDDVMEIGRPKGGASCLACKTAEYEELYEELGDDLYSMDFDETAASLDYPVTCYSCHENEPGEIHIKVPHAIAGFEKLDFEVEAGIEGCAQCHVEYYVDPDDKAIIFPWDDGITAEDYIDYYDRIEHSDWTHPETGTGLIKIQHPEFEMYNGSLHDDLGLSCADCHMPTLTNQEGEEFVSHWMTSPLKTPEESCFQCHSYNFDNGDELVAWVNSKQQEIEDKEAETSDLLVRFVEEFTAKLSEDKLDDETIEELRSLHRNAQIYWDFIFAENSTGSHNFQRAEEYLEKSQELAKEALDILEEY
ncbi:MAG: ammonia-forming cytochrome c nitrite reductase subunit c552 [Halanaerobiaceae bacterium]